MPNKDWILVVLRRSQKHVTDDGLPPLTVNGLSRYVKTNSQLSKEKSKEKALELIKKGYACTEDNPPESDTKVKEINLDKYKEDIGYIEEFEYSEHENLTEIAQKYADHLVEERNIRPVVIDGATLFYEYSHEKKKWVEKDWEIIKKMPHKHLDKQFTNHFFRQFKQSYKNHHKYISWNELGLPEHEALLKNGKILDIRTRELRDADKSDKALNGINAIYNPEAKPERIDEFLKRTIDTEEGLKALQEYLGYCLEWPSDQFEKALLILGNTDTGKSTLLKILEKFFENSNTTNISFPQLGMDRAFHIDDLKDSVVNFDHDMSNKSIDRPSRIKKITSHEEIRVDPKGKAGFKIRPKAKFIIASNNAPDDSSADEAFYNRFVTVTATNRIDDENKERNLVEEITTEENMSWLLNWAIEGLERLKKQNKFSNERTEYDTKKEWDKFGSSVQKFISQQIETNTEESKNIPTTDVFEAYELWCETQLETPKSRQKFIAQAASHPDLSKAKTMAFDGGRRMCFKDIEVKDFAI